MYVVANIIIVVDKIATLNCVAALGEWPETTCGRKLHMAGKYAWPESIWPSLIIVGNPFFATVLQQRNAYTIGMSLTKISYL